MAQVAEMSGEQHLWREAAQWRDATPETRLAVVVELCRAVPQLRELWPPDVATRADLATPLPDDVERILLGMRRASDGT